jgi:hypothetical protein
MLSRGPHIGYEAAGGAMRRTVLEELRQLRRRFAALAALVLALPILMSALPRDARSAALAEIGNAAICSISAGAGSR